MNSYARPAPSHASYIVTDIEADGPDPGANSMISLASVARGEDGEDQGEFTVNFELLDGASSDPGTMAWWSGHSHEWQQAREAPVAPALALRAWADWALSRPGVPVFVSHPISFDGAWLDYYLQRFLGRRLFIRPRDPGLFHGTGVDIPSMVMAATGWSYLDCKREKYPPEWFGGHHHTHHALQDTLGYAHLFGMLRRGEIGAGVEPVAGVAAG
ncbi:DNA polymerase III subunit epsilon [Kaistia algarum]|uniref:DNA polymerase III subunit epsilon n=1 Tax=Kaistia algarum TaxID=2083279 RepID=UPI0010573859|nr:DNA polymerase III subunit epsilon [Kaistia algarum]MCX5515493.1 DNA polymerase III subunit epsilon [Kaistia algarum]